MGERVTFSQEIADRICEELIEGRSMRQICRDDGMPNRSTVLRWMDANPDFAAKCARARDLQADYMDDLILETADACTPETAQADKVKISAYQWRASKLAPRKYGDKVEATLKNADGESFKTEEVGALSNRVAFALMKGIDAET